MIGNTYQLQQKSRPGFGPSSDKDECERDRQI